MKTKQKPLLLLPIEIKAREFPARVFLAGQALAKGYDVIIGQSKIFHKEEFHFPRGVLLENDGTPKSKKFFAKVKKMGFKTVAWDEESLVTLTDDIYASLRISDETLNETEYFFCRGAQDRDAVLKLYPQLKDKLIPTGNPRLDILQPQWFDIDSKSERPLTILINSRFSIVNPYYIAPEKAKANVFKKFGIDRDSETGRHIDGWLEHADVMFHDFADLTRSIARACPQHRIIIRPHPSENHDFWKDLADEFDNCESLYEGSASDWFAQADVLVHNSCTTAMEATLLGLPCFTYLPKGDNVYDAELPNSVSDKFYDQDSLIKALQAQPRLNEDIRQQTSDKARANLSTHIACIDEGNSAETVMEYIEKINLAPLTPSMAVIRLASRLRFYAHRLKETLKGFFKGHDEKLKEARKGYASQKFPGITPQEMEDSLRKYGFDDFTIQPYKKGWLKISPK